MSAGCPVILKCSGSPTRLLWLRSWVQIPLKHLNDFSFAPILSIASWPVHEDESSFDLSDNEVSCIISDSYHENVFCSTVTGLIKTKRRARSELFQFRPSRHSFKMPLTDVRRYVSASDISPGPSVPENALIVSSAEDLAIR